MIQRIQTLWLLLAAIFDAVTFRFPFYNGDWLKDTIPTPIDLDADLTIPLTIVTVLAGALAFACIFFVWQSKFSIKACYSWTLNINRHACTIFPGDPKLY